MANAAEIIASILNGISTGQLKVQEAKTLLERQTTEDALKVKMMGGEPISPAMGQVMGRSAASYGIGTTTPLPEGVSGPEQFTPATPTTMNEAKLLEGLMGTKRKEMEAQKTREMRAEESKANAEMRAEESKANAEMRAEESKAKARNVMDQIRVRGDLAKEVVRLQKMVHPEKQSLEVAKAVFAIRTKASSEYMKLHKYDLLYDPNADEKIKMIEDEAEKIFRDELKVTAPTTSAFTPEAKGETKPSKALWVTVRAIQAAKTPRDFYRLAQQPEGVFSLEEQAQLADALVLKARELKIPLK